MKRMPFAGLSLIVLSVAFLGAIRGGDSGIGLSVHAIRPGVTCPVNPDTGSYKVERWKVGTSTPTNYVRYGDAATNSGAIGAAFSEWGGPTGIAFSGANGTGSPSVELNEENAIFFDQLSGKTIAVAYVWFNLRTKEVVEFDMVFNSDLGWGNLSGSGDCVGGNDFDVQDIAAHEIGHIYGIGHMSPNGANNAQSMYPYAAPGEIYKRTLANGDLAGIAKKYGAN